VKHFLILVAAATAGLLIAQMFGGSFNLGSLLGGTSTAATPGTVV
jgi:hypothetical protein